MSLLWKQWEQLWFQRATQSLQSVKQLRSLFLCGYYWKYRKNPTHTNYNPGISNPSEVDHGEKTLWCNLSSSFCWILFLSGFSIFKCNFLEVLKPPGAHLNLISSISSSVIASTNVKCVHGAALILYPRYSFDHMGLKLGGIFIQSYASLPLCFKIKQASQDHLSKSSFEGSLYFSFRLPSCPQISSQSICPMAKEIWAELVL